MKMLKRIFTVICCLLFIAVSTFGASAIPDTSNWPSRDLQKRGDSNSDFDDGTFRYKYDFNSNQIQLWFYLKYVPGSTGKTSNAGVVININNRGNITVTDTVADYNDFVYYVDFNAKDRMYDEYSRSLFMSFTVGLKDGFSDRNSISIYVLDLQGKRSNIYTFDISDTDITATQDNNVSTQVKTTKSTTVKTTKPKTTKATTVKTTKSKTTKVTTVKSAKTTKNSNAKTNSNEVSETLVEQMQAFVPTQNVKVNEKNSEKSENNRKVVLIFGATATIIAVISGCAIGIRNKRKK